MTVAADFPDRRRRILTAAADSLTCVPMRVELLWWEGCPSHPKALADLRTAMNELGLDPSSVELRQIETEIDASHERFIGSPTIRIDGHDVTPVEDEPFGLTCRVYYRRNGRVSPTPDPADLRDALSNAMTTTTQERS